MPSIFKIGGFSVFFWSNEQGEPIHVHISKGNPSKASTKVWLTSAGGCLVANNGAFISPSQLNEILDILAAQFPDVCSAWKQHFNVDTIKYFC
ncbi:MAG: DUF4160 domain-containing protein [Oscillospiraceae bacterium]